MPRNNRTVELDGYRCAALEGIRQGLEVELGRQIEITAARLSVGISGGVGSKHLGFSFALTIRPIANGKYAKTLQVSGNISVDRMRANVWSPAVGEFKLKNKNYSFSWTDGPGKKSLCHVMCHTNPRNRSDTRWYRPNFKSGYGHSAHWKTSAKKNPWIWKAHRNRKLN